MFCLFSRETMNDMNDMSEERRGAPFSLIPFIFKSVHYV